MNRASAPSRLLRTVSMIVMLVGLNVGALSAYTVAHAAGSGQPSPRVTVKGSHGLRPPSAGVGQAPLSGASGPPNPTCCTPPLVLGNGPVQRNPHVYLVFWGPKWQPDTSGFVSAVETLFNNLGGGDYNNLLSQYYDDPNNVNSYIHNDTGFNVNTDVYFDKSTPAPIPGQAVISMSTIGTEAASAQQAKHWPTTGDTQIMVFPQQGTTQYAAEFNGICGEHGYGAYGSGTSIAFGFVRFLSDYVDPNGKLICNFGSTNADDMVRVASHEYAETATDPHADGSGWHTTEPVGPNWPWQEIGDLCNYNTAYYYTTTVNGNQYSIDVTYLYDNATKGCSIYRGSEYGSPAAPYKHTVQGAILGLYDPNYVFTLGSPVTEEYPVPGAGGSFTSPIRESDFQFGNIYYKPGIGAHEVQGAILSEYLSSSVKGPTGALGFPVSNETGISSGRVSYFAGQVCDTAGPDNSGSGIYYSSGTGAHEVQGCIFNDYWEFAGGPASMGFPTTDEQGIAGGRVSYFAGNVCGGAGPNNSGGAIYYTSATAANSVRGCIYHEYWAVMGGPGGALGFPTWDEQPIGSGRVSYFAGQVCGGTGQALSGSAIYYLSSTGAHEVQGCIYNKYWSFMNGPTGALGFPTADERGITSGYSLTPARYSTFQHGAIYYYSLNSNTYTYEVQGAIYNAYLNAGGASGSLGLPVSDEYAAGGTYRESDFENGYITYDTSNGSINVVIY